MDEVLTQPDLHVIWEDRGQILLLDTNLITSHSCFHKKHLPFSESSIHAFIIFSNTGKGELITWGFSSCARTKAFYNDVNWSSRFLHPLSTAFLSFFPTTACVLPTSASRHSNNC